MTERDDATGAPDRDWLPQLWSPDEVRPLSTAAILEKLASFGIAISEDDFRQATASRYSAVALSEEWWKLFPCTATDRDEDFPWCAAMVLWERLAPEWPCVEMLLDAIDDANAAPRDTRGGELWLRAWEMLQRRLTPEMTTFASAEERFGGELVPGEWAEAAARTLRQVAEGDRAFGERAAQFCREVQRQFVDEAPAVLAHFACREAEALWLVGSPAEAEATFEHLVQRYPTLAEPYRAWADCHLLWAPPRHKGYETAVAIYQRALAQPNLADRASIALRLAHLHDQRHDQAAADHYRHLARLERKRRAGPTPPPQRARERVGRELAAAGIKPGRNDPCRCGSGKKYKRCHLAADERRARDQESPAAAG